MINPNLFSKSFLYLHRIVKISLASTISWEIARQIGSKHPFFAPLAAILCLQVTVEESIQKSYQRILGIIAGVLLAEAASRFMSVNSWSIGLLIFISLTIAKLFKFDENIFSQVGVSALMVMTVGTGNNNYGFDRIIETIIGAITAIIINMFILPPDYTKEASQSLHQAASDLAEHVRDISKFVYEGRDDHAKSDLKSKTTKLYNDLDQATERITKALHALHFSPLIRKRRKQLIKYQQLLHRLQQVYIHLLEVQRIILEWKQAGGMREASAQEWGDRYSKLAEGIEDWKDAEFSEYFIRDLVENMDNNRFADLTNDEFRFALQEETFQLLEDLISTDNVSNPNEG
ncbi:FUSC family protein [Paenibacillus sp. GP183]|uniref:FUSC family protein n=1 Tax=Paenibacillus sp. GP183 TaxID=1882751 RepID=UPI000895EFB1|nr:FUSC family protein [Paenibacillus sp. GP183]SEB82187.1 Uncharacterized membrane protein YgaE, UPF0421/DUF939 family [Paenibacillus sp. GP183]